MADPRRKSPNNGHVRGEITEADIPKPGEVLPSPVVVDKQETEDFVESLDPTPTKEEQAGFTARVRALAAAGAQNQDLKNYILNVGKKEDPKQLTVSQLEQGPRRTRRRAGREQGQAEGSNQERTVTKILRRNMPNYIVKTVRDRNLVIEADYYQLQRRRTSPMSSSRKTENAGHLEGGHSSSFPGNPGHRRERIRASGLLLTSTI